MILFISFLCGAALFYLFGFFPCLSLSIFVSSSALALLKRNVFLPLFVIAGVLYAFIRFTPIHDHGNLSNKEIRVTGRFAPATPPPSSLGDMKTFSVEKAFDEEDEEIGDLQGEDVRVYYDGDTDYDKDYDLLVQTGADRTRLNPGVMGIGKVYAKVEAARATHTAPLSVSKEFDAYRSRLNAYLLKRFKEDSAALVASITTGETSYLRDGLKDAFNATGLAHILSISGTHFGLFSVMIFWAIGFLIKRLPYAVLQRITLYLTPAQASALFCLPVMIMYLGISGGGAPAVRSFIMISLFLAGLLIGRKGFWLNSVLLAAFILVLWDPGVIFGISFQLSFLAVLFIGFSVEEMRDYAGERRGLAGFVKSSLLLTMTASIGTSVLVAYYFHYFSIISPLSNLLIAPLIGFVLVPLAVISSFSFLLTGHYIFAPLVALSADLSVALVKLAASFPFADVKIASFPPSLCVFFYAAFVVYLATGRKKKVLVLPFIPLLIYAVFVMCEKRELSITFLDVGQGDSAVIEMPDEKTVVVDTGRTGREAASFLQFAGKRKVDALVLTHAHPDHAGGAEYLASRFATEEIWDNGMIEYPADSITFRKRRGLERGDVIEAGDCTITVLHPWRGFYTSSGRAYEEENEASLVLSVKGRRLCFLLAGDAGKEAEEDMVHLGRWLRADVLKVPHHGGKTSTGEDFVSRVSPSTAVISAGRGNPFGHPSGEVLERLKAASIFRTDRDGAVKITETKKGMEVRTYRDFALEEAEDIQGELKNIKRLFTTW